jgi:hypothetical protein
MTGICAHRTARIDVKRTLRIELRMSAFGGKRPSNTATLAAEWRPWSLFSEVARFLQTGRTIEDPYDRLLWSAVVRSRGYGRRQCANSGHSGRRPAEPPTAVKTAAKKRTAKKAAANNNLAGEISQDDSLH